jgi:hypothetical protein
MGLVDEYVDDVFDVSADDFEDGVGRWSRWIVLVDGSGGWS